MFKLLVLDQPKIASYGPEQSDSSDSERSGGDNDVWMCPVQCVCDGVPSLRVFCTGMEMDS